MHHRHLCSHACFAHAGPNGGARPFRLPGDRPQWGRARSFSLDGLRLDVALDLDARAIDATAIVTIRRIDPEARWAHLDAIDFTISAVERDGKPAAYEYDGDILRIDLSDLGDGASADVTVRYRATPRRGLYFTAPDEARPDRPRQVWSQCQDQDGRHWFPCQDHPGQRMSTELSVVVPAGWFALSNGVLAERADVAGGTRFHWKQEQPHPAYLVTLAAGEFDEAHAKVGELPVDYFVPKGQGGAIERSLGHTPEMIRLFSEKLATPYPWAKYAQVVVADFIFGGMENTSATTLFERALVDERAVLDVDMDALVAHELAHQWFGDLVTCRDWSHAWLNEGFATYMEHVWKEHHEGRDAYFYNLEQDLELYLAEHGGRYGRPVVEKVWATPIDVFDRHLYQKGGLILHALRVHLGDAAFWRGLAFYLERHRGGSVETRDLLRALEDSTGRSLEEFFAQWVLRAGHPALEVAVAHEKDVLKVTVTQTQMSETNGEDGFTLRLPIAVTTATGREEHTLQVTRRVETFAIPAKDRPTMVVVDEEMTAPGTVELKVPTPMLLAQLADAPSARARWLAARALGKKNEPRALDALKKALVGDSFWAVRVEAAKALGEQKTHHAFEGLKAAEADADPHVRRAVASAFGRFETREAADQLLHWMERGDPSYLVEAALRRALGETRDERALDELTRRLREDGPSWGDVVRSGAAEGLAKARSPKAIEPLLATLRDVKTPATLRRAIVSALSGARQITSDEPLLRTVREAAEAQLDCYDPNVRIAVARLLTALGQREGFGILDRLEARDLDGRVRRAARESRRDLSARLKTPPELSELRDEVEKLRRELVELRSRVETVAAAGEGSPEG